MFTLPTYRFWAALAVSAVLFTSCSDGDEQAPATPPTGLGAAFYVVNEGGFNAANGNITLYDYSKPDSPRVEIDYFKTANNGQALGDIVQSIGFNQGKGFILVNGSGKVEVVDSASFASLHTLTTIAQPRYFKAISATQGYITDWATNTVQVLDLQNYAVTGTIPVATGPEQIVLHGSKAYVSNTGGFGNDSTVSVINTATNTVESTITTGIKPSAMLIDKNHHIWVLCTGQYGFGGVQDKEGELVQIDPANNHIKKRLPMPAATDHPTVMALSPEGDFIYYVLNEKVFKMSITDNALPTDAFVTEPGKMLYGIAVNKRTGDVIVTEAPGAANGQLLIYDKQGVFKGSLPSGGQFPNGVVIR